ncbi:imelysin family protein [Halioxenophilus sp. WMMB6]|uniref:imelysin family protein n=1 Tax=Halioxenophilus sp. WMMB6 TaxID=3073815 RepID=UPI00295F4D60|nr:imelysin family protein [Halioxenophilus sp. WMMB6]
MKVKSMFLALGLMLTSTTTLALSSQDVINSYTDLAFNVYTDSLAEAKKLQADIQKFLDSPSPETLAQARYAWRQARVPYMQTEAFRFGNPVVDNIDGQVNSWPLDEGFLDYVSSDYEGELGNSGATAFILSLDTLRLGANEIDVSELTPELLASLNELGGSEANIATGYHAIEFLLWGQDLNGTDPGAGNRPYTDYLAGEGCSHQYCQRRRDYLTAVTTLLVNDLNYLVGQWQAGDSNNYRAKFVKLAPQEALTRILFGIGSLAFGELAGERMQVALEANSPEDEQDCFSDNTVFAHYYDWQGIANVYLGEYKRVDGSFYKGDSLADLVAERNNGLAQKMQHQISQTHAALQALVNAYQDPNNPMAFDQMIAEGNVEGAALINQIIAELAATTELIEGVAKTLGITNLNPNLDAG